MVIHIVQPDETINSIAEMYGISAERLISDNLIEDPNRLVAGESLLVLFPRETNVVQEGDSLEGIANSYGVSVMQLLRNNPQLSNRSYIYPGEEIIISFTNDKLTTISVNGYAFPFIDMDILSKTLPFLTFLTIYFYEITKEGEIIDIDDQQLIDIAKVYGVAPIMLISTVTRSGETDAEATHNIITSKSKQELLINSVLDTMRVKGYYGINIDIQNILPEDRQLFIDFMENMSSQLRQEGYYVITTLTLTTFGTETDIPYLGPEYATLGQLTDSAMLLSYEWGHIRSPLPALPLADVRALLDYSITQIPAEKTNIGIPTIGYIWDLPFIPGRTVANVISHNSAVTLAKELGVTIQRDAASEAPYYSFSNDTEFIVWFRDVKSISAILDIVVEYGLEGIGIWNIMQFPSGMLLMINEQFEIRKIE